MQGVALGRSDGVRPRSGEVAIALALVPFAVSGAAAYAAGHAPTGPDDLLVAISIAAYWVSPAIGSMATAGTLAPRRAQVLIAVLVFAAWVVGWAVSEAEPTHPG